MPESITAATAAANLYKELGALAFLIIIFALAFIFMVWRVVKTQDKISATLDRVNERQSTHDQRAIDMHTTCKEHGTEIKTLGTGLSDVKEKLGNLSTDVKVLQEKVG